MRCENCREADLVPAAFVYERMTAAGECLRVDVQGFECPNCADRVIRGRDAERISRDWYAISRARTAASALFSDLTTTTVKTVTVPPGPPLLVDSTAA